MRKHCDCVHMNDDVPLDQHAHGCGIRCIEDTAAGYVFYDVGGTRVHHWMPKDIWAVGFGPIRYVSKEYAQSTMAEEAREGRDG